ncbi:outer membrane protein assembly factor BamC [Pseudogulbenkiania sp. MAI-1]|uniref:outer membrane protein assembly factor BamC n=1 Tax=Pseudogulbenkiania sp. MAI-1 TaxID=990370 RepID=UPI00045E6FAD|nr:outer membrane protein assembly factor BamC [Pseudogulbenkiania sp. MAI-1]
MKRSAPAAILLLTGLMAGCSTSEPLENKLDYKTEAPKNINTLEVPPDLTAPQIRNRYELPRSGVASLNELNQAQGPLKAATTATAATKVDNIRMERAGSQRWLVAENKQPEELWPVLKAFWQDNGFVIKTEEPQLGIMETDWAENRAKLPNDVIRKFMETVGLGNVYSTSERDKFRIRVEKTAAGTEVYFSHRGMYEVFVDEGKSETKWQPRPADPQLEAELLGRFMIRLGQTEEKAKEAIKQTQAPETPNSQIVDGKLTVNDGFDRAWRRVGLALDRIGLVVSDRNRSQGIYYVKPAKGEAVSGKTEKSGGFWSSLAFWSSGDKGEAAPKDEEFLVQLKEETPGRTQIVLSDKAGKPLPAAQTRTALGKLQNELQ